MYQPFSSRLLTAALLATLAAGCSDAVNTPTTPTGVTTSPGIAANPDGSTLKATPPSPALPGNGSTGVDGAAVLVVEPSQGVYVTAQTFAYRFQVSDSAGFATLLASGAGAADATGRIRYTAAPTLPANRQVFWRARAESDDRVGPWSAVFSFTVGSGGSTGGGGTTTGPRPTDPAPGQRLPLPDMQGVLARFSNASDSCPRGIKYVNNPWQDRVIDAFRQIDSRWGYNAKPTRTAADNGGVAVIAAGDEAAYHYSAGPDQGSTEVHLVDLLVGHCGPTPFIGWRVFTGEEPGRWTGAGRF